MAIFNAQFDSVTKKFSVSKDGVDLPDIRYFSIGKYGSEEAYMSMEQSITVKTPEEGIVEEVRIWSTAEDSQGLPIKGIGATARLMRASASNIPASVKEFVDLRDEARNAFAKLGE